MRSCCEFKYGASSQSILLITPLRSRWRIIRPLKVWPQRYPDLLMCNRAARISLTYHRVKVFGWYLAHNLPVTPINPSCSSINVPTPGSRKPGTYVTQPDPSSLQSPSQFSLSVITPPKVTRQLLREAKEAGVQAVWLQPGSFDNKILDYARKEWPKSAIGGTDVPGSNGGEGWCVLVDGDWAMQVAGRRPGSPKEEKL